MGHSFEPFICFFLTYSVVAEIFRGQIVDVTPDLYTVQLIGTSEKLDAFIGTLKQATDIVEVVRSGVCGIARGERSLHA